jgi:hypothetical protein
MNMVSRPLSRRITSDRGVPVTKAKRLRKVKNAATAKGVAALPKVAAATSPDRRNAVGLLGFLHKAEVDQFFKQQPFQTVTGEDPLDLWRQFDAARAQLAPIPTGQIVPAPDAVEALIAAVRQRPAYVEHYERAADYRIASAPIESLLTPQWYADTDYIDEISKQLPDRASVEDQLKFAFTEGRIGEPIVSGNTVLFSSARRDLHVDAVPRIQRQADGEFTIFIRATSRPNYIQVAEIGERLLLVNGVHKVCALYRAGFTHCYCVVRKAHDVATAGLDPRTVSMLRPPVFDGQRPAAVTDFLNVQTAVPLTLRSMNQVLQVVLQSGTLTVPALSR